MRPLVFATEHGDHTNFVQLLLKAGADPNIPDDVCVLHIFLVLRCHHIHSFISKYTEYYLTSLIISGAVSVG